MKQDDFFVLSGMLLILTVVLVAVSGWVMNIISLAHATSMNGMVVLRAVGIFVPPLGAVLGWI